MIRSEVTELFTYQRCVKRALDVLRTGMLYSPKPAIFNDPFDCAINFQVDYEPSKRVEYIIRSMRGDKKSLMEIMNAIEAELDSDASLNARTKACIDESAKRYEESNGRLGVVCLAENPLSVLMWSHYGRKHAGVCLGFHRHEDNTLGKEDQCAPVVYTDEFPKPVFSEIYQQDGRLTNKLMLTKAREWAYEKEWRLLTNEGGVKMPIPAKFSQVIVGCKTPDKVIEACKIEAERIGIPLRRAKIIEGKFALELENIADFSRKT